MYIFNFNRYFQVVLQKCFTVLCFYKKAMRFTTLNHHDALSIFFIINLFKFSNKKWYLTIFILVLS